MADQTDLVIAVDSSQVKSATEALKALGFQATTAEVASDKLSKAVADIGKSGTAGMKNLTAEAKKVTAEAEKLAKTNFGNQIIRVDTSQVKTAVEELRALGFASAVEVKIGGLGTIQEQLAAIKDARSTLADLENISFSTRTDQVLSATTALRNLGFQAISTAGEAATLSASVQQATNAMQAMANVPMPKAPNFDNEGWSKFRDANIAAARAQQHSVGLSGLDATQAALRSLAVEWSKLGQAAATSQEIAQNSIQATNAAIQNQANLVNKPTKPLQLSNNPSPTLSDHFTPAAGTVYNGLMNSDIVKQRVLHDLRRDFPSNDYAKKVAEPDEGEFPTFNTKKGGKSVPKSEVYKIPLDSRFEDIVKDLEALYKEENLHAVEGMRFNRDELLKGQRFAALRDHFDNKRIGPDQTWAILGKELDGFGLLEADNGQPYSTQYTKKPRAPKAADTASQSLDKVTNSLDKVAVSANVASTKLAANDDVTDVESRPVINLNERRALKEFEKSTGIKGHVPTKEEEETGRAEADKYIQNLQNLGIGWDSKFNDVVKVFEQVHREQYPDLNVKNSLRRNPDLRYLREDMKTGDLGPYSLFEELGYHLQDGDLTPVKGGRVSKSTKTAGDTVEIRGALQKLVDDLNANAANADKGLDKVANSLGQVATAANVASTKITSLKEHRDQKGRDAFEEATGVDLSEFDENHPKNVAHRDSLEKFFGNKQLPDDSTPEQIAQRLHEEFEQRLGPNAPDRSHNLMFAKPGDRIDRVAVINHAREQLAKKVSPDDILKTAFKEVSDGDFNMDDDGNFASPLIFSGGLRHFTDRETGKIITNKPRKALDSVEPDANGAAQSLDKVANSLTHVSTAANSASTKLASVESPRSMTQENTKRMLERALARPEKEYAAYPEEGPTRVIDSSKIFANKVRPKKDKADKKSFDNVRFYEYSDDESPLLPFDPSKFPANERFKTRIPFDLVAPTQRPIFAGAVQEYAKHRDQEDSDWNLPEAVMRDGKYHLTDGHHRAVAASLRGQKDLLVEVIGEAPSLASQSVDKLKNSLEQAGATGAKSGALITNSLTEVANEAERANKAVTFLRDPQKASAPPPQTAALFKPPVNPVNSVPTTTDFSFLRDPPKAAAPAPAPQVAALFKEIKQVDDSGLTSVAGELSLIAKEATAATSRVAALRNEIEGDGINQQFMRHQWGDRGGSIGGGGSGGSGGGGRPPAPPPPPTGGGGGDEPPDDPKRKRSDLEEINSFKTAAQREAAKASRDAEKAGHELDRAASAALRSIKKLDEATTSLGATGFKNFNDLTTSLGAVGDEAREAATAVDHLNNIRVKRLERLGTSLGAAEGPAALPPNLGLRERFAVTDKSNDKESQALLARLTAGATKEVEAQTKVLPKNTHAHDGHWKSVRRSAYEQQQLAYQLHDFTIQVLGGQSPLLALVQQGSQLAGTFGGIRGAISAVAALMTPTVLAIGGAVTAVAALGVALASVESKSRAINTLQVQFQASGKAGEFTDEQLKKLLQTLARIPGVSKDAAFAIVSEFSKAGQISSELAAKIALLVPDFARGTGQEPDAAARQLAQAFEDPVRGIKVLEEALKDLSSAEIIAIRDAANRGDRLRAQALQYEAVKRVVEGLAKTLRTDLENSTNDLKVAWSELMRAMDQSEGLKNANSVLGTMLGRLTKLINYLPEFEKKWGAAFSGGLNGAVLRLFGADTDANRTMDRNRGVSGPITNLDTSTPTEIVTTSSAFSRLPKPEEGVTSSFVGSPEKVLSLIAGMKNLQERSNAFAAYTRQLASAGTTLKSVGRTADEEIKDALKLGESYRSLGLRIEDLTAKREKMVAGLQTAISANGADSPQAVEISGQIEGIDEEIKQLTNQKNSEANRIGDLGLKDRINAINDALSAQRNAIATQEALLQTTYTLGETSIKEFFDRKVELIKKGTDDQIKALDERIEVVQARLLDPKLDAPRREQFEDQLRDLNREKSNVRDVGANQVVQANDQARLSFHQLTEQVEQYRAELLQLQGDEAGAAKIQTDIAIRRAKILATNSANSGLPGGNINPNDLRAALDQQNALNRAKEVSGFLNERLTIQEATIGRLVKDGSISELSAMQQIGAARQKSVEELEKIVKGMEEIAALSQNKDNWRLQLDTAQAREALEQLKAEMDPLKEKFDNMFRDGASGAIADFLNGTRTAKEALDDFGKHILKTMNDIVSKELSHQLFGKDGIFGDAGGLLAKVFGRKNGTSATAEASATSEISKVVPGLKAAVDPAAVSLNRVAQAADSAAASLNNLAGKGGSSSGESLLTGGLSNDDATRLANQRSGDPLDNLIDIKRGFGTVPSGEQSVMDQFKRAGEEGAAATETFGESVTNAGSNVLKLATSAAQGGGALSLLPTIISAISASAGTGGSGGGGLINGILGLFKGGSGYDYAAMDALVAGFDTGGYTGDGGKYEPAGIVHKGEFVNRKEVVAQPGAREFLADFNDRGMDAVRDLKGYAIGGLVGQQMTSVLRSGWRPRSLVSSADDRAQALNGGRGDTHLNVTVQAPAGGTRESAMQWGAAAGRQMKHALARNG